MAMAGSVAQTATITITGVNDAPILVMGAVTDGSTEDDTLFSVDMLDWSCLILILSDVSQC